MAGFSISPAHMEPEAVRATEEFLYKAGYEAAAKLAENKKPEVFKIGKDDYIYYNGQYELVEPVLPQHDIQPNIITTFSLDGLIDFIRNDVDGYFASPTFRSIVRITSPTKVVVETPISGFWKERSLLAECAAPVPSLHIGDFLDTESFQIMLQANFEATTRRDELLKFVGSMKKEQNIQTADDGVSQRVQINQGVSTAVDAIVKNPFCLTPVRTFQEVEQPESPFVLRFREDGSVAIFLGDGGAWKYVAVRNIKNFLVEALKDCNVVVIG